jgi:hypothetical protein
MSELSEVEYNICMMAVLKCDLLWRVIKSGLPLSPLTEKNFGFPDMTNEEVSVLVEKLHQLSQIAWLKEQRGNNVRYS